MARRSFSRTLHKLWSLERFAYSIRFFIALTGVMLLCWLIGKLELVVPLFLGIIASTIAETDDHWKGRIKAVLVTLVCFGISAASVTLLFPYPWLFAIGLAGTAFCLTLLGAAGNRYSSIAAATLILSVYTMINVEQRIKMGDTFIWKDSIVLVAGAAWYGLLSVIWNYLFSHQTVQHSLTNLFDELGDYLEIKAALIEPANQLKTKKYRLALAKQNSKVVNALNTSKQIIISRLKGSRHSPFVRRYLRLYFLAQDIHERASSSHYPYHKLTDAFFHSDVLFRCQRLLTHQAKACHRLGRAVRLQEPFVYNDSAEALADLKKSIDYVAQQPNTSRHLLHCIKALAENLTLLEEKLIAAKNPDALADEQDSSLYDGEPHNIRDVIVRLKQNLTIHSLVFRHALRLAIALTIGYGVMRGLDAEYGFWILLTTLFVCRPSYGATRVRLVQRIIGTTIGVIGGWVLISLYPNPMIESLLVIVSGVLFFTYREKHYMVSTIFITLMVLLCFNQLGNSAFTMIIPRLLDTFIGCAIAVGAVFFIFPDWQGRRLNEVLARTLCSNANYLREIMRQYETVKQDDLSYRTVRRNAHNADAALSTALASMLLEPGAFRKNVDVGFRFLALSNTLLSYLSALGAHREKLTVDSEDDALLTRVVNHITGSLDEVASQLINKQPVSMSDDTTAVLVKELEQLPDEMDDVLRLVLIELRLICKQLGKLKKLAAQLQHQSIVQQAATS